MSDKDDDYDPKATMLEALDVLRRRVETGQVQGFMVFAEGHDETMYAARRGQPPSAPAILALRRYVMEAEELFFELNFGIDDHVPLMTVLEGGEPANEEPSE